MKYQLVFDQLYSKTKRTFCIFISTMGMVRNGICNSIVHMEYKRIATKCQNVPKSDKIIYGLKILSLKNNPLLLTWEDL